MTVIMLYIKKNHTSNHKIKLYHETLELMMAVAASTFLKIT